MTRVRWCLELLHEKSEPATTIRRNVFLWFERKGMMSASDWGLITMYNHLFVTYKYLHNFSFSLVVQSLSCVQLFITPQSAAGCFPVHHQLPGLAQTHGHWVGDAIQLSHPRSSPSPPAFNLSQHKGLFQWVSSSHRGTKFWSFSFSISPSKEYSGLIFFRIDWFDIAVQGTLKGLLQHHSSKASILHYSVFLHPYLTTGKTIALTRWTFVGKVMPLLFNMLSRFVIAFLPRSKGGQGSFVLEENKWLASLSIFFLIESFAQLTSLCISLLHNVS